jgi:hypothetical protein
VFTNSLISVNSINLEVLDTSINHILLVKFNVLNINSTISNSINVNIFENDLHNVISSINIYKFNIDALTVSSI